MPPEILAHLPRAAASTIPCQAAPVDHAEAVEAPHDPVGNDPSAGLRLDTPMVVGGKAAIEQIDTSIGGPMSFRPRVQHLLVSPLVSMDLTA
jgi:hypothetical protein